MYFTIFFTFYVLVTLEPVITAPQFLNLPVFPPPVEINDLKNKDQQRSISTKTKNNNLEETVKEVEAILKANTNLPRLTRGEILDLLENITKTDLASSFGNQLANTNNGVTFTSNKKSKSERDPKAVMLVMPYTPDSDDKKNMEDLYTKAPITHIIGPQEFTKNENEIGSGNRNQEQANKFRTKPKKSSNDNRNKHRGEPFRRVPTTTSTTTTTTTTTSTTPAPVVETVHHFVERPNHRRRRPTSTTTTTTTSVWSTTNEPVVTTYSPVRRRPTRRRTPSPVRYTNHRYPEEEPTPFRVTQPPLKDSFSLPSDGLRIVAPPELSPSTINGDLLMVDNNKKEVYADHDSVSIEKIPIEEIVYDGDLVSQPGSAYSVAVDAPHGVKGSLPYYNIDTPSKGPLRRKTTPKPLLNEKDVEDDEAAKIREMLIAFGALPLKSTATTTAIPDISQVADNLSPDMKELLMSFGLIPTDDNARKPPQLNQNFDSYNPEKPDVNPDAYIGFKPLPDNDSNRNEMQELLARFGLGRNTKQHRRGVKKEEEDTLRFEVVPDEYKEVLDQIGLSDREGKMIRAEPLTKTNEKQHVFNPQDTQYASEEEMKKLNKLLGALKQLGQLNRTVTDEDLKSIDLGDIKELATNLNNEYNNKVVPLDEQVAPNPLVDDFGLSKNEVKRQEDKNETVTATTTIKTIEEVVATTEEDNGPSIKDLEDSFGGQSETVEASSEAPIETTTQARRTGFYYLVDWNSFLDIDDQKGKRVNLRFQPTIGDPKRFYSVSVP